MTVAVFSYTAWVQTFPEFLPKVTEPQADRLFVLAGLYCDNSATGRVPCDDTTQEPRKTLLNLLTAHLAKLLYGTNTTPPTGLVGRVSKASEGSVSVEADLGTVPWNAAFFAQTEYGLMFWQATVGYRSFMYVPPPPGTRVLSPTPYGFGRGWL